MTITKNILLDNDEQETQQITKYIITANLTSHKIYCYKKFNCSQNILLQKTQQFRKRCYRKHNSSQNVITENTTVHKTLLQKTQQFTKTQ